MKKKIIKTKWGFPRTYYGAVVGKYHLKFSRRYAADVMRGIYRNYMEDHSAFQKQTLNKIIKQTGLVNYLY